MALHSIFSRMIKVIFKICLCLFWLPIAPPYTWWDVARFLNWYSKPCSGWLLSTTIASLITKKNQTNKKNQTAHNTPSTPWYFLPFTLLIGLKTISWSFKFYFNPNLLQKVFIGFSRHSETFLILYHRCTLLTLALFLPYLHDLIHLFIYVCLPPKLFLNVLQITNICQMLIRSQAIMK